MIGAAVVFAALSVWAPVNNNTLPCPPATRPHLATRAPASLPGKSGWAPLGGGCDAVTVLSSVQSWNRGAQCALLAHEFGHAIYSLPDTDDPHDLMDGADVPVPAVCARLDARRVRVRVAHGVFDTDG